MKSTFREYEEVNEDAFENKENSRCYLSLSHKFWRRTNSENWIKKDNSNDFANSLQDIIKYKFII